MPSGAVSVASTHWLLAVIETTSAPFDGAFAAAVQAVSWVFGVLVA
ncbi:MAG: hypothetical protein H6Q89_4899 [Myxococcaceae bacterium]|nr:hypothetical protein [Myxococcaceae bacterium]